jgi:AraC-like DNA-binding protein
MRYFSIPPPASLARFVRCFWVLESDDAGYVHRSMAEVCSEMVFHYKGLFTELKDDGKSVPSFSAGIQTQSDQIKRFSIHESFGIFGVYFFPYTFSLLTRTSATGVVNSMMDLNTLFGREGSELEERMMLACDNHERVAIITSFLELRLSLDMHECNPIFSAIQHVMNVKGDIRVRQIADQFAFSERQFERKFKNYAGFSPKLFSRIVRFHAACSQYNTPYKSLAEIALDCGYYDQSHFIHEFKQFSGHHPKSYFAGKAEGTEWRE